MAEIAVQRKKTFPWWVLLLVALLALLLVWLMFGRADADVERQRAAGPITDLTTLYTVENPDLVVGRDVRIERANVLSVTGDRDFWVGDGQGRQVLVILNEVMTPAQPRIEGRYDVNSGQTIGILEGEVKRLPSWDEARTRWNLNENIRSNFDNQRVYIEADKLDIKDARQANEPVQTQPK